MQFRSIREEEIIHRQRETRSFKLMHFLTRSLLIITITIILCIIVDYDHFQSGVYLAPLKLMEKTTTTTTLLPLLEQNKNELRCVAIWLWKRICRNPDVFLFQVLQLDDFEAMAGLLRNNLPK